MNRRIKIRLLIALTVVVVVGVTSRGAIPQKEAYHNFCDNRTWVGIPNFANVFSNLAFCVVGVAGLFRVPRSGTSRSLKHIYYVVFSGIVLTGLGSGLYHLRPTDRTLVFDRLPITIVFMSMVAASMEEGIGSQAGRRALWPLVGTGLLSVWWWHYSGDLRLYILAQYYPMLLIPAVLLLFKNPITRRGWNALLFCFGLYALAKVVEFQDCQIYDLSGWISGHTLKHLLAASATGCLVYRYWIMHGDEDWLIWSPKD
jgi:hypothetical protein